MTRLNGYLDRVTAGCEGYDSEARGRIHASLVGGLLALCDINDVPAGDVERVITTALTMEGVQLTRRPVGCSMDGGPACPPAEADCECALAILPAVLPDPEAHPGFGHYMD